ncbi:MAG: zinc ABC transporter substrate-binding protein [Cyanobacteria bacterium P01_H01_bin.121]
MKRSWFLLSICVGLFGCTSGGLDGAVSEQQQSQPENQPQVVVTNTILASLAQQVGGDAIQLTSLLQPGDDPHIYEPLPQDSRTIAEAELILLNGYNMEPALTKLVESANTEAPAIAVAEAIQPLDFEYEGQREPDPHVWGDVENAVVMVEVIRDALIDVEPEQAELFRTNAEQLTTELVELDGWIAEQIELIPPEQRKLVTTHDAFQYYGDAYELEILGTLIGISTEEQPSAQTVTQLVETIRVANVPTIFAETTINPGLIERVAQEAQVQVAPEKLYSDSIGTPDSSASSYQQMMRFNTQAVVDGLNQ